MWPSSTIGGPFPSSSASALLDDDLGEGSIHASRLVYPTEGRYLRPRQGDIFVAGLSPLEPEILRGTVTHEAVVRLARRRAMRVRAGGLLGTAPL